MTPSLDRRALLRRAGAGLAGGWLTGLNAEARAAAPRFLLEWGRRGKGEGEFDSPIAIAIDPEDRIYVTDFKNLRVQRFQAEGRFLQSLGKGGSGPGDFHYPHGLAVDSRNHLYVVDAQNNRIQKFDLGQGAP